MALTSQKSRAFWSWSRPSPQYSLLIIDCSNSMREIISTYILLILYLFVEEDVYDGVVHGAALGQVNGHRAHQRVNLHIRVGDHQHGQTGVRQPADQEGEHHQNDHESHLHLSLSGRTAFHAGQLWRLQHTVALQVWLLYTRWSHRAVKHTNYLPMWKCNGIT